MFWLKMSNGIIINCFKNQMKKNMKSEDYLCKCLNCDNILIDENPQVNAKKHTVNGDELKMVMINNDEEYYVGCPICNTDAFLIDL